jgi:carbon storage regulator
MLEWRQFGSQRTEFMLLITRRTGEAIVINGSIEVKVLEVKGGRVKLGFEYPAGSSVFRQELFARIQAENKAAALSSSPEDTETQALPNKLSMMVQNLRSSSPSPGEAPAGDQNKGSKNDNRNVQSGRPQRGSAE